MIQTGEEGTGIGPTGDGAGRADGREEAGGAARCRTDRAMPDFRVVADRYRALLELGDEMGVVPQVEVWGFSRTLGRLSEAAMVAIETGHSRACILPDVYHLHRGGSDFGGVSLLSPRAIHVFHFNDFPAAPCVKN